MPLAADALEGAITRDSQDAGAAGQDRDATSRQLSPLGRSYSEGATRHAGLLLQEGGESGPAPSHHANGLPNGSSGEEALDSNESAVLLSGSEQGSCDHFSVDPSTFNWGAGDQDIGALPLGVRGPALDAPQQPNSAAAMAISIHVAGDAHGNSAECSEGERADAWGQGVCDNACASSGSRRSTPKQYWNGSCSPTESEGWHASQEEPTSWSENEREEAEMDKPAPSRLSPEALPGDDGLVAGAGFPGHLEGSSTHAGPCADGNGTEAAAWNHGGSSPLRPSLEAYSRTKDWANTVPGGSGTQPAMDSGDGELPDLSLGRQVSGSSSLAIGAAPKDGGESVRGIRAGDGPTSDLQKWRSMSPDQCSTTSSRNMSSPVWDEQRFELCTYTGLFSRPHSAARRRGNAGTPAEESASGDGSSAPDAQSAESDEGPTSLNTWCAGSQDHGTVDSAADYPPARRKAVGKGGNRRGSTAEQPAQDVEPGDAGLEAVDEDDLGSLLEMTMSGHLAAMVYERTIVNLSGPLASSSTPASHLASSGNDAGSRADAGAYSAAGGEGVRGRAPALDSPAVQQMRAEGESDGAGVKRHGSWNCGSSLGGESEASELVGLIWNSLWGQCGRTFEPTRRP